MYKQKSRSIDTNFIITWPEIEKKNNALSLTLSNEIADPNHSKIIIIILTLKRLLI